MDGQGRPDVTSQKRLNHGLGLSGIDIGSHTDHPTSTHRHERQGQTVVTAEDGDGVAHLPAQLIHPVAGSTRLLDMVHVGMRFPQSDNGGDGNLYPAAGRNRIQDDRFVRFLGDGREMPKQALLTGLIIIGGHLENTVDAHLMGQTGETDGLTGRIRSAAGDNRHPALGG